MIWPVPNSFSKTFPRKGNPGSFWLNRGDRFHCGVDIYSPALSEIVAPVNCEVIKTGVFTSKDLVYYWNKTHYVDLKMDYDLYLRLAEMDNMVVKVGDDIKPGDIVGYVGTVLNKNMINDKSPDYIKDLKSNSNFSMLHFELYDKEPIDISNKYYLGGNWFLKSMPKGILDPEKYFKK